MIVALGQRLRGRCLVFPSDQRVHVETTGLFTYPDVTAVCVRPRFHPNGRDTLVDPRVLIRPFTGWRYPKGPVTTARPLDTSQRPPAIVARR